MRSFHLLVSLLVANIFDRVCGDAALCQVCWCREDSITCDIRDSLSTVFDDQFVDLKTVNITSIFIRNQANLVYLDSTSLRKYTHLKELIIIDSGLQSISPDAFKYNLHLTKLDFRSNNLTTVPWKLFETLIRPEINLDKNPLSCNCDNKWIQETLKEATNHPNGNLRFGPNWPMIISQCNSNKLACRDSPSSLHLLTDFNFNDKQCKLPVIRLSQDGVQLKEHESLSVSCYAEGNPTPTVYWNVSNLVSKYQVERNGSLPDGHQQVWLTSDKVHNGDAGNITCMAENQAGRVYQSFHLIVYAPPKINKLNVDEYLPECLRYEMEGIPIPRKTWLLDHVKLESSNGVDDELELKGCLNIKNIGTSNLGVITLIATNEYGTANTSVTVHLFPDVSLQNVMDVVVKNCTVESFSTPQAIVTVAVIGTIVFLLIIFIFVLWSIRHFNKRNEKSAPSVRDRMRCFADCLSSSDYSRACRMKTPVILEWETIPLNSGTKADDGKHVPHERQPLSTEDVAEDAGHSPAFPNMSVKKF